LKAGVIQLPGRTSGVSERGKNISGPIKPDVNAETTKRLHRGDRPRFLKTGKKKAHPPRPDSVRRTMTMNRRRKHRGPRAENGKSDRPTNIVIVETATRRGA